MTFVASSAPSWNQPEYAAESRTVYVRVGGSRGGPVARSLTADGVVFDCDDDGFVKGIEILLNSPQRLVEAPIEFPRTDDSSFSLVLTNDPEIVNSQVYDAERQVLQLGRPTGNDELRRIGSHVIAATTSDGKLVVWITGLSL